MYALVSLFVILSLSMLVVRIGTVALSMTGLSREVASFQSLSAFSTAGFTTTESEDAIAYPSRRRIVKTLMRLGNVGIGTSLVIYFADPVARAERLLLLVAACLLLLALARSAWLNRLVTPVIRWGLRRSATFEPHDYTSLLNLDREYRVANLVVEEGDWLADERIADLELRSEEGIVILGIERDDGTYIGAPGGGHAIYPGDEVIAYGQEERLRGLVGRTKGDRDARREAERAHRRLLAEERDMDPRRRKSSVPE